MSARKNVKPVAWRLAIATPQGEFVAHYSAEGLCGLDFPSGKKLVPGPERVPVRVEGWHVTTRECVLRILAGREPGRLPPLDLSRGTEFQQRVWRVLAGIGRGETLSYGQVAAKVKRSRAVRAVGGACGANPIPLIVPCHRVLAANGRLGGFSGGLGWKRALLQREGVPVRESETGVAGFLRSKTRRSAGGIAAIHLSFSGETAGR